MFSSVTLFAIFSLYLAILFFVALWVERKAAGGINIGNNPYIYSLTLAVYCTAWTYYGNVGMAATSGMLFLTIALGPTLAVFFWWSLLRKMVRIKSTYRITNIADFLAARYDKSRIIAAFATLIIIIGIVPYMAVQIKAVLVSIAFLAQQQTETVLPLNIDLVVLSLILFFTIIFGVRRLDITERHQGMMVALAVECIVKLMAFLCVGLFITFLVFDGFGDMLSRAGSILAMKGGDWSISNQSPYFIWFSYLVLSMSAVMFLPRQFHVAVVENFDEDHIRTAMWVFPLYMFLINVFAFPIAVGGLLLGFDIKDADFFALSLPVFLKQEWLALFVFLGGVSAAIGMIMISSMTLSTMVTNHLLLPVLDWIKPLHGLKRFLLQCRWAVVACYILSGYLFVRHVVESYLLANIGMMSFAAILQFAPIILGGLFWQKGNKYGAMLGLGAGFLMWAYTLLLPAFIRGRIIESGLLETGPFGVMALHPEHFLSVQGLDHFSHAVFWTMFFNIAFYILGSLCFRQSDQEQELARSFISILDHEQQVSASSGMALIPLDEKKQYLVRMLRHYFPAERADEILQQKLSVFNLQLRDRISIMELLELYREVEKELAGSIGSASAHYAVRQSMHFTAEEENELSRVYAEIITNLKLTPADLKAKIDYYQERESLLSTQAAELSMKVDELNKEVAERRRAEEQISRLLHLQTAILNNAPYLVISVDRAGCITTFNEAAERLLGYSAEECVGKKTLAGRYSSAQGSNHKELFLIDRGARRTEDDVFSLEGISIFGTDESEWYFLCKNGSQIPGSVLVAVLPDESGAVSGFVLLARDLTERKKAEQAFRDSEAKYSSLINNLNVGIYRSAAGPHGEIIQANPALANMLGFSSSEELMGLRVSDMYQNPERRKAFSDEVECYGSVMNRELAIHKRDGTLMWVSVSASAKYDDQGNFRWIDGVVENITERKHLEEQLRQAQKMEAIGTLAGGVAHDFNNILTAIIGYVELLRLRMGQGTLKHYVDEILGAAERAAKLTRSLLAFSRRQVMTPLKINLNDIVQGLGKFLMRIIGEDIEFRTEVAEQSLTVMVDTGQIEQVLMNLATNARDAMPGGGVLVIRTERVVLGHQDNQSFSSLEPGEYAVVSVSDTGTGMDAEMLQRIFEPFYTTKERGKGTGLGLSIVYGIIKQHGGDIKVYSEPGRGTTFKIYLKLIAANDMQVTDSSEPVLTGGTETILVAEDDSMVRNLMNSILSEFGYTVLQAVDGEDAVEKFRLEQDRIDMLLFDVVMPKKNGREAYEQICTMKPGVPILFASGYPVDIVSSKGILPKGTRYVQKPVVVHDLLVHVRECLDRR